MFTGFLVGVLAFVVVGLFHPLVVRVEYTWGRGAWWVFILVGVGALVASLWARDFVSMCLGSFSAGCFWGALELFWQHRRACLGRAKRNPARPAEYYRLGARNLLGF